MALHRLWDIEEKSSSGYDINHNPEIFLQTTKRRLPFFRKNLTYTKEGRVLLDFSCPATWPVKNGNMYYYIQYFNGYGESLLDYNKYVQSVRIGLMLARK